MWTAASHAQHGRTGPRLSGDLTDAEWAVPLLKAPRARFPFVALVHADTAYAAARVSNATSIAIRVVGKIPGQVGFEVHPRRWVVEHCFAWLNRNRAAAGLVDTHLRLTLLSSRTPWG